MHDSFFKLLKEVNLQKQYIELFKAILLSIYQKRYLTIKQRQNRTEFLTKKLRDQRQALIDKNLSGIYSDEDFKEQFDLIDNRLNEMITFGNQAPLEKYTNEEIQKYIQNLLSDLPKIFEKCDMKQKRTFISLFFPKGLMWNYPELTVI